MLLNRYSFLWKTLDDEDFKDGYDEFDYFYNFCDRTIVVEYTPTDFKSNLDDPEYAHCIEEMNIEIDKLCKSYLAFVDDLLRVKYLYTDFIYNYLNVDIKFLDNDTLASNFMEFMKKNPLSRFENFRNFTSGYSQFYHTAISVDGKSILCESYDFQSLGAFLYFDLFRGIRNNYQPKKCESCGKYFLLTSGKYTLFCENNSTIDSTKTCREISSRKKYSDKCKLDPIWKTYKNAYTSNYARYMRNKMTTPSSRSGLHEQSLLSSRLLIGEINLNVMRLLLMNMLRKSRNKIKFLSILF